MKKLLLGTLLWVPFVGLFAAKARMETLHDWSMRKFIVYCWYQILASLLSITLLAASVSAQSWEIVDQYEFPLTSIDFDSNGVLFSTIQSGELYRDHELVKVFPVQYSNEAGLVTVEVDGYYTYLHISGLDSVQRIIRLDTGLFITDTLLEVSYKKKPGNPYANRHRGGTLIRVDSTLIAGFGIGSRVWNAQDSTELRGKIVQMNVNTGEYEIRHGGVRNPFRGDWNPTYGEVWFSDNGANDVEEINLGWGYEDFGFPCYERDTLLIDSSMCEYENTPPIFWYSVPNSGKACIGGVFWREYFLWSEHYPDSTEMSLGGKIDSLGNNTPMYYPAYVTDFAVYNDDLYVSTWGGTVYKYEEEPLSIDTIEEEEEKEVDRDLEQFLYDLRLDLPVLDVIGRRYDSLPYLTGFYMTIPFNVWIFVGTNTYVKYKNQWIKI
jgi:hypothetical protein